MRVSSIAAFLLFFKLVTAEQIPEELAELPSKWPEYNQEIPEDLAELPFKWPAYNQQCRDDAGPPFGDDVKKYYDGQKVKPVLMADGSCVPRMERACAQHKNPRVAYLEGPLACKNEGWYCRIVMQDGWPNVNLRGDLNFGHCNSTASFSDDGYDRDGHCHGSSDDSTYYWWIRDHFNRQYNGRVRCCCGWYDGEKKDGAKIAASSFPDPMYKGRIGNRCDYRRLVTQNENLQNCRDANEDHGLGFDDTCPQGKTCVARLGCDAKFRNQIGKPIPENDNVCWEMQNFGYSENGGGDDDKGDDDDDGECGDKSGPFFFKKSGNAKVVKNCAWLRKQNAKKIKNICKRKTAPVGFLTASERCKESCKLCKDDDCRDEPGKYYHGLKNGKVQRKPCSWLAKKSKGTIKKVCKRTNVPEGQDSASTLCWKTCNTCDW
mmetsp:Transcript_28078/g.64267  ORF Transcript_28078/g.64267 Transcript_28078/m.64267 type:complete len:433 (-) Transcript_28078:184-1482(-)